MEKQNSSICDILNIKYPIIMAPMFLVSNIEMLVAASKSGITGAIPALNFRTIEEFEIALKELKEKCEGPFGINLIVNKSNFLYKEQLTACCKHKVDYIITSLGSPEETINQAHKAGVKVFCDVTDLAYAKKVEALGADALIAVNKEAGGHAGNLSYKELIPLLIENCNIPVISAGGVGNHEQMKQILDLGAAGLSIGSLFIASSESGVSQDYKEACVNYGAKDIVFTTKLSGSRCTVIKTPYVEKIGTDQNFLEKILNKNKQLKKWFKAFTFYKGMKNLQNAAFGATYKTVWCAGPTIEYVKEIKPINDIVKSLVNG
ncbi:nitronate monooxygenase [Vicingus serpentipes]|jgi:nitronate monooxygenase|uniref:Nitronate monooxygenase n=1 Tax=Vicingus serpentipes TaxID=1926625 RepID=A0A5C6RWK1_9FLAO|nr:nitronate monooxygenase [Vicingus serpentipes]TXB66711.1 nitronate monooxygenase [Vicingus serpentipes]